MKYYKLPIPSYLCPNTYIFVKEACDGQWYILFNMCKWIYYSKNTISAAIFDNLDTYKVTEADIEAHIMMEML